MSHPQKPPSINGVGRRRIDKDCVSRSDNLNWRQAVRTPSNFTSQGWNDGIHERLLFMHTCLVGQHVEVQKIDGHVYSGIFHAAIKEKEFGVILKMARLIRESAPCFEGDSVKQAARKPPIRTYVIQSKDFVQIIARDISLSVDTLASSRTRENRSELVTDAVVSQRCHRESERELKPWKPDDEFSDPSSINLSNAWSRNWDQFEANKALFGVETTFDEELYTTKLVRGPQLREREREAQRIAREIIGQQTRNVHLAEERGVQLAPELEAIDEETKYSSVGRRYQDVGDDDEDQHMDAHNNETFGGPVSFVCTSTPTNDNSCALISDGEDSSVSCADLHHAVSGIPRAENVRDCQDLSLEKDDVGSPDSVSDSYRDHLRLRKLLVSDNSKHCNKGSASPYSPIGKGSPLLSPLAGDPAGIKALNLDPSCPQVPDDVYREFKEFKQQKQLEALKALNESFKKDIEPRSPGTQASAPVVTASKKSPLNINTKDFKLNPNAKSFTPSSCLSRSTASSDQHPLAAQSPTYINSIIPAATVLQTSPGNIQNLAQQIQYSPYSHPVASGLVGNNSTSFMASPGSLVPGFPVGGVGGGGILPGQLGARSSPHSQQQAQTITSYGHPQHAKYHPTTSALHSGLLHPNGQLYPPHVMYGQPTNPVVYMPFHQRMMQGHSVTSPGQGRLYSQPQQCQPQSR